MTNRRNQLLALLALVVLVVVAVLLFVGGDDDEDDETGLPDERTTVTLPDPVTGGVSAEGEELLALLDRGEEGRYHAVYEVQGDPSVLGGEMTLELWRDGDRSRRDTRIVAAEGTADTATIVDDDGRTIACNRIDEADWTCFEAPEESTEDVTSDAGVLIGSVRDQLEGAEVTARDDEIDGRGVRCFAFETVDGPGEICADEDGVVVRLASGENAMVLTTLDDDVPGDVFSPPAEVGDPPDAPDAGE